MINDANDRKSEADAICNFSSSALMMMAYALLCVPQVFSTNLEFGIVVVVKCASMYLRRMGFFSPKKCIDGLDASY